jgi:hypothetical protein
MVDARVWKQVKDEARQSPVTLLEFLTPLLIGSEDPQKPSSSLSEGLRGMFTIITEAGEMTCIPTSTSVGPPHVLVIGGAGKYSL